MADTLARRTAPARILIIDDHPLVRDGLATRISAQSDMVVCGEAGSVDEAIAKIEAASPDAAIVDISLKGGSGIELIKRIRAMRPEIKMLVATMHDESVYGERALHAGAHGYVNKQEMPELVITALRQILDGKLFVSPQLSERIVRRSVGAAVGADSPLGRLSDRELEVFRLLGQGLTTRQIAGQLDLSVKTVESHRENIKTKLDVKNSAELTRLAVQWVLEGA